MGDLKRDLNEKIKKKLNSIVLLRLIKNWIIEHIPQEL